MADILYNRTYNEGESFGVITFSVKTADAETELGFSLGKRVNILIEDPAFGDNSNPTSVYDVMKIVDALKASDLIESVSVGFGLNDVKVIK